MITREAIEQRVIDLEAERDQLIAKIQAITGALQDCQYWLQQIDAPDE